MTESKDGLLFWKHRSDGSLQVTEHYIAEYVISSKDKGAPRVSLGVFQRTMNPAPAKAVPLRRYSEVLQQRSAPVAPTAPTSDSNSCGGGGGSCG